MSFDGFIAANFIVFMKFITSDDDNTISSISLSAGLCHQGFVVS